MKAAKELTKNMIYIVTAMYAEAHPFIIRFQLKKDIFHTRFQVFLDSEKTICLIISGTGMIPAAAAVSHICTKYGAKNTNHAGPAMQGDFLLNVGVCARIQSSRHHSPQTQNAPLMDQDIHRAETSQIGKLFLCNKITDQAAGRTFYPDILYRHSFAEAQIITGPKPYEKTARAEAADAAFYLYDMEAAAVYQAGACYLGPHQMSFLKIVSDNGNTGNLTSEQIERLVSQNMDALTDYTENLQDITGREYQNDIFQESSRGQETEQLCLDLHCSRTMSQSLHQYIRYCILSDIDYSSVLEEMYSSGRLPCKDRREGKQCFEELKERLL